ncbi:MAG: CPBP family intramembrane glutamic endopeptidase [Thermoanaerobaculia bacterium]|nr:CPBP family intramembrane glutamic endopeptidase [Thermoanaerobaculia bacterium]
MNETGQTTPSEEPAELERSETTAHGAERTTGSAAGKSFHPFLFAGLAIGIAWSAWTPLLLHVSGVVTLPVPYPVALFVCQTLGAFAPLLALVAIQRLRDEPGLVNGVLRTIRFRRVALRWLLLPPVVPISIAVVTALLDATVTPGVEVTILRPDVVEEVGWALLFVIPFTFVVAMIGSPLGEEPGWRGYLLDRFAQRSRPLAGSAVVAALWWVWHIPLLVVLGVSPNARSFLEMAGHSLLIDSFFLLSGRNLLVAMLYHQGVNIGFMFFQPRTQDTLGLAFLLATAAAVRFWCERRLRGHDHPDRPVDPGERIRR